MPRLFGTDGIRGIANDDLTPDLALALGRAAGKIFAPHGGEIIVGRDTRVSGPMLEGALVAGLCSAGADVRTTGVLPTPAVAFLTQAEKARAGAVISASHNPVPDNGIKFFSERGIKVSADDEEAIEALMEEAPGNLPVGAGVGRAEMLPDAADRYVDHLLSSLDGPLEGLKVVLDCAYGAAWHVGPQAFREAGAGVVALHADPDGTRINVDCGSTSLATLSERVRSEGADLGLAFDGDADRVLAVDERGEEVDGDRIIAMSALRLLERDALENRIVVVTVMANLGFRRFLEENGIDVLAVPVGDKYVADAMQEHGAVLGGEQSGHVIFGHHASTGDGVLTALKVAETVVASDRVLSELAHVFEPFPQVLINVTDVAKERLEHARAVWDEVALLERQLGDGGRVLVRASGTEPVVRVMVEATEAKSADSAASRLAVVVARELAL